MAENIVVYDRGFLGGNIPQTVIEKNQLNIDKVISNIKLNKKKLYDIIKKHLITNKGNSTHMRSLSKRFTQNHRFWFSAMALVILTGLRWIYSLKRSTMNKPKPFCYALMLLL